MADNRIRRKNALSMDEVVDMYIREMKLSAGLNTQRIFAAWDEASGAADYTIRRYFRNGKLHISVSSSVVRRDLSFQKDTLIDRMNSILAADPLFTKDDVRVGLVRELILK